MENKNDKILLIRHLGRIVSWLKSYVDSFYSRMKEVTDNADRLTAEMHQLNTAVSREEENRVSEENKRRANEEERTRQESTREDNERVRRLNEDKRIDAEAIRNRNEIAREQAEQERVSTFEGFNKEIASKQPILTTSEDLDISSENELSLTDLAKMRLFCDLFNEAAGEYGYARIVDGKFDCKLNEFKLTYEEALSIYNIGPIDSLSATGRYAGCKIRTNLPMNIVCMYSLTTTPKFVDPKYIINGSYIEVLNLAVNNNRRLQPHYIFSISQTTGTDVIFEGTYLRKIIGAIDFQTIYGTGSNIFNTPNLEEVNIGQIHKSLDISKCPKLNLASFQYMVNRRWGTNEITVTVHPDVYAKLTGDTTNEAAALLTEEELGQWQAVLTDASAKNISFATV